MPKVSSLHKASPDIYPFEPAGCELALGAYQSKPMIWLVQNGRTLGAVCSAPSVHGAAGRTKGCGTHRHNAESTAGCYVHTFGIKGAQTDAPVELQAEIP